MAVRVTSEQVGRRRELITRATSRADKEDGNTGNRGVRTDTECGGYWIANLPVTAPFSPLAWLAMSDERIKALRFEAVGG